MQMSENKMIVADALSRIDSVKLSDVHFSYYGKTEVIKGVSMDIKSGQTVALVGPSGGGKSTLASLMCRFFDVQSGSISIGGADVRAVPKEELMDTVSFVFQNSRLIKGSILDNVKLGRLEATEEEVLAALRAAQCMDIIEKFPDGIHTVIGTKGVYLSGGEQQRIAIARAFLKDAPIILLDEATASLDVENETLIQTALSRLVQNKTVLIIAHRMHSTRRMGFTPTWCSSRPAARTGRYEPRKHEGGDGLCAATALSFLTKAASDDTIHPLMFPRG